MAAFIKSNLRTKLLIIILLSQIIGLAVIGFLLYSQFETFLYDRMQIQIRQNLNTALLMLKSDISWENSSELKNFVDKIGSVLDARATLIDSKGLVIADSEVPLDEIDKLENHLNRPEVQQAIKEEWGFSIRRSKTVGRKLIYVCKLLTDNGSRKGFMRLSLHSDPTDQMLKTARLSFIGGGLLILLISGLLVILLTRQMNRNLQKIIDGARQISEGKLLTTTEINSHDELQELGKILNEMSASLSKSFNNITRQHEDLNAVLSSINDGIIAIGSDKRVVFYNEIGLKLLGYVSKDIEGKYYYDLFLNKHLISLIHRFFEKPFFLSDEIDMENERVLEVVINPFKLMDSDSIGAVLVFRDITNYKKLERIRRDFVANVSHEFKNPLASIQGFAETLLDWGIDDANVNRKYLKKIVKQSKTLEHLVADLLQLARIEGFQSIEMKSFDPMPILKELKFDFSELVSNKNIQFKQVYKDEGFRVFGDPEMFRTIIANLIDNAIKYSPENSEIILTAGDENGHIEFSVKDTGIGIPKKYLNRIFERFYRVDKARSREVGGTGLGLSIVKHMAELQQAKYGVESEINIGSRFWIKFRKA